MKKIIALIMLPVLLFSSACQASAPGQALASTTAEQSAEQSNSPENASSVSPQNPPTEAIDYKTGFQALETAYTPIELTPSVKGYTINPDLSNIANISDFPSLTAEQMDKIAQNGFVVTPTSREQLFYVYEENSYEMLSSFVTVDSVLQVYHIFFDYALRTSETEEFYPRLQELNTKMLNLLIKDYEAVTQENVKKEIVKAIGYFGVASMCLGVNLPSDTPAEARELIYQELDLMKEEAAALSPLTGILIDYSQFIPRGHYTRSDVLSDYFKAMMWYGLIPFRLYNEIEERDESATICAIIITKALFADESGPKLWEEIYSPTCFFVGDSDDITPFQYKSIMDSVYGNTLDLHTLADKEKLNAFYLEADKLPKPQISPKHSDSSNTAEGIQFRFMGQRYIADSEILQELSEPLSRPVPTGLDIFAVLGSSRAADLVEKYFPTQWAGYAESFQKLYGKFSSLPERVWQSNIYYGWLWSLKSLIGEYGEGYPQFMQNTAWQDKSLATALGSWAELRHDTVLYGKQSGAEKGGGSDTYPASYVEPNVELYNKLLWLTRYTKENLAAREMLSEKMKSKMESFEEMLGFLLSCAIKELNGEALTELENSWIFSYGGRLEHLSTSFVDGDIGYWYEIESETDKNMALISDVHNVFANQYYPVNEYLEEAVGQAAEIYVAIPVENEIYLARGAVFDYYEFLSQKRLTDEEWQQMLNDGDAPDRPAWVSSFMAVE